MARTLRFNTQVLIAVVGRHLSNIEIPPLQGKLRRKPAWHFIPKKKVATLEEARIDSRLQNDFSSVPNAKCLDGLRYGFCFSACVHLGARPIRQSLGVITG